MSADLLSSESPIFTVAEAAKYLRVGPKIVRRWVKQGRLPHRKIDKRGTVRLHRDTLDDFVRNRPAQ